MDDDLPITAALTRPYADLAEAIAAEFSHRISQCEIGGAPRRLSMIRILDAEFSIQEAHGMGDAILSLREQDLRVKAAKAAEAIRGCAYREFLGAVLADPHDDAPRLILADRLDDLAEAGAGPRYAAWAETIRLAVERFRTPGPLDSEESQLLSLRLNRAKRKAKRADWGALPLQARFFCQKWARGFPAELRFNSPAHAIRWATALGTWLPAERIWTGQRPWINRMGAPVWGEAAQGYQWWSPAVNTTGLVPAGIFRYLGPPKGLDEGARGSGLRRVRPVLQRSEDGTGRRYFIYEDEGEAQVNLAEALADFARVAAGYKPLNNPRPLPY